MSESAVYEIRLKDRFTSPLSGLETKMNGFEKKVGGLQGAFNGLGGSIAGAFTGGLIAGGITSIITGLKQIASEAIETARQFRNMEEAIRFASGDDAEKNIKFLDDTINRLGLDVNAAYKGFKTWQGALMGTRLEGEEGRRVFTEVSKAATVMKLSGEQTEGAFLALGQMISKGTVSAEELRGQLGERLPGAFQIAARAMGVTTAKLGDMMKQGEVVAEDFLPKFATELSKTFSPGVLKAQLSFNANMNRFSNFVQRAKIALGESLIPAINELVSVIPQIDFEPLLFTFKQLKDEIVGVFNAWRDLFNLFGGSLSTFEAITLAFRYLAGAIRVATTPIRVAIQVYTQLVTLVKNSLSVFAGLGEVIMGFGSGNFDLMTAGIDNAGKAFTKMVADMKASASEFAANEGKGWDKIFGNDPTKNGSDYANGTGSGGRNMGTAGSGKESTAGVEKIASGTRNINITINKLIENVAFQNTNGLSQSQLQDMIKKALLTAVNDVNIVAQ